MKSERTLSFLEHL